MKRAGSGSSALSPCTLQIRLFIPAIAAFVLLLAASAQSQPSASEMLADTNSLGPDWERKIYLSFDSAATPAEIIQTTQAPPESALEDWRRSVQDPNGKISGWVLAHYSLTSATNGAMYEAHLERYRNHGVLLADFEKLLETAVAQPGSMPLTHIGDAAALVANLQGAGATVWFRRGNVRVWINPIGPPRNWDQDASLHLLAQAIDQRIVSIGLHMRAVADGADVVKKALEEAVKSPTAGVIKPQFVVKVGDAFIPLSQASSSNSVSIAFDHWGKQGSDADSLAVFRLTNSGSGSILLWNVRVQIPTTNAAVSPSGWETVQDDYPSATSAVCEAGSAIEFWVSKPVTTPWRLCILYSRELSDSDRSKDSQRNWTGNYEVIGQPVH